MACLKCRLKRVYWKIRHIVGYDSLKDRLLGPPRDGIRIRSVVVAKLYKDGKLIETIKGEPHNKWTTMGFTNVMAAFAQGCTGTLPMQVYAMSVGSLCSDVLYTHLSTGATFTATVLGDYSIKFVGTWSSSGLITGICQARLMEWPRTGNGSPSVDASYYNFVTTFSKPDGVSMTIEWTTTFSS